MKSLLAAAAVLALMPAAASAQSDETRQVERRVVVAGPGMHMQIDGDGLTREQFLARHTDMFARMDADNDGVVTAEEMQAHHRTMMSEHGGPGGRTMMMRHGAEGGHGAHHGGAGSHAEHGERRMHIIEMRHDGDGPGLDTDGDGRISFDELAAPLRRHFDQMDADGSGYLEEGERGPHAGHRGH